MDTKVPAQSLNEKVKQWFESEGYPLEFRVARVFEEHGFNPHQGYYVINEAEGQPREIDVLADMDLELEGSGFFRVSHVIECKWSRDKPWVIFTDRRSRMAESACIAQTIGSSLGEAVTFCVAGETALHQLAMFKCPERGGFSGRRAFEKQDKDTYDQFYRTVQGVVSAAAARAKAFNSPKDRDNKVPRDGVIVFPIVVVDANLFEAYYDAQSDEVRVSEVDQLRVLWRGSTANRRPITTLDVVTAKTIGDLARTRASEVGQFFTEAARAITSIRKAFKERSFDKLDVKAASRGFTGLPQLLVELYELEQSQESLPKPASHS